MNLSFHQSTVRGSTDSRSRLAATARWPKIVGLACALLMIILATAASSFFPWGRAHPTIQLALLGIYAVVLAIFCIGRAAIESRR